MKNRNIIIITIITLAALTSFSCIVGKDHVSVRIPVKDSRAIDFKTPKAIWYRDLVIENQPKDYQSRQQVTDFFLQDLPRVIKRDVEVLPEEADKSNSLIISGTMKFDIKDRSVIRKVRADDGEKKKTFVSVQHWAMDFEVIIIASDSGKEVFKKNYESKLKDADPKEADYNFKALFNTVTDNFLKDMMRKERFEQRYLLLR